MLVIHSLGCCPGKQEEEEGTLVYLRRKVIKHTSIIVNIAQQCLLPITHVQNKERRECPTPVSACRMCAQKVTLGMQLPGA